MKHCCDMMDSNINNSCEIHPNRFDCPDMLLHYDPQHDVYGIIIHDEGTGYVTIQYCPWCGTKLPDSRADEWLEKLEKLGLDPAFDEIPDMFKSDAWYRSENE